MDDAGDRPWLSAYPEHIAWDAPLPLAPVTDGFDRTVEKFSNRPCLNFLGKSYSYQDVDNLVRRAAKGFQALGVKRGVKVGLLLPNTPYAVISFYAILKAGGTVVNMNPLYTAEEIEHLVADSGARIVVTLDLRLMLPKVSAALEATSLEKVVVCHMADILPFPKNYLFAVARRGEVARVPKDGLHILWSSVIDNDGAYQPVELSLADDIAVLQYTGGTTGVPKGAMLSHGNIAANANQLLAWCPRVIEGEERIVGVLPLFHVFAMTVVMNVGILGGAEILLMPRFKVEDLLKLIDSKQPTIFPGVPTIFTAINNFEGLDRYDLSSLKFAISAGAGLPIEVKLDFERLTGCMLVEGYGLSETSPAATCNPFGGQIKAGSIGQPLPGTDVQMRDLDDPSHPVPLGEKGEICIRGPQVMPGYWNRPDATADVMVGDFLRTGDVGIMDDEGFCFLVDRIKDVIISGGYKVYPRTIEEAIYRHEGVAEATVIAVPDDYRGEAAKAFVKLKDGVSLGAEELVDFLKDKLSPIEMPDQIEFRDELPKTLIGKLSKKELVAEERAKYEAAKVEAQEPST
ncbi:MAG: long-chain fatty acid--CoA ligase [Pseudomonadota bacterium]